MRTYKGRRDIGDDLMWIALIGAVILCMIWLITRDEPDLNGAKEPEPLPVVETVTIPRSEVAIPLAKIEVAKTPEPSPSPSPDEPEPSPDMTHLGTLQIYGYDPWCSHCVGKQTPNAVTASGAIAETGRTVAMHKSIPFGTEIYIEGLGYYVVEDRGVSEGVVDVAVESHSAAYAITSKRDVWIVERG